ncbi:hypothetical protein L0Y69_02240 [bacterium]|nr:hypothetical protein [bacterium]
MPIPEDTKQQIKDILEKSTLSPEYSVLWRERLESIADTYSYMFLDLFAEDASELPKATERMKEKAGAIDDDVKLGTIVEVEKNELIAMLKKEN